MPVEQKKSQRGKQYSFNERTSAAEENCILSQADKSSCKGKLHIFLSDKKERKKNKKKVIVEEYGILVIKISYGREENCTTVMKEIQLQRKCV